MNVILLFQNRGGQKVKVEKDMFMEFLQQACACLPECRVVRFVSELK